MSSRIISDTSKKHHSIWETSQYHATVVASNIQFNGRGSSATAAVTAFVPLAWAGTMAPTIPTAAVSAANVSAEISAVEILQDNNNVQHKNDEQ